MKNSRHEIILSIIKENKIRTHESLVEELAKQGIYVTQATVSRDIKELGVVKVPDSEGSIYAVSARWDNPLRKFAADVVSVTEAGNLVIVRTHPGMASAVAAAVDKEMHDEIAGSIAGDDTIFIAVASLGIARELTEKLNRYFSHDR
ncbi:MAG: arginine repressor [Clostridia bacterium]|nr:arginine repressor [Clostridia bacterium]